MLVLVQAATETALHRDLFDSSTGLYANRLYADCRRLSYQDCRMFCYESCHISHQVQGPLKHRTRDITCFPSLFRYNGSFYRRWAPTVFSPMLLNSTRARRCRRPRNSTKILGYHHAGRG